jgi:hypothetical protein
MAILADHSDLPRPARAEGSGLMPDLQPRFVPALVEAWRDADAAREHGTHRGRLWFSSAGKCARALSYQAAGIPQSDPMDLAGTWNVNLGSIIHDRWQESLKARFPGAEVEIRVELLDGDLAGRIDAVVKLPDGRVVVIELKSIGGYGFKACVGKARRGAAAEGPRSDHILQGALGGLAVNADEVVIGYLAKECISEKVADGLPELARFSAEWSFSREDYEPLAKAELDRMAGVLRLADGGTLAARKIPDLPPGAEITDPSSGVWRVEEDGLVVDTGSTWACGFCSWQTTCATTERGRISIESVQIGSAA